MKMAKRVLALIVSVIMIVGTCAVAASAAVDYQAELNAGHDITLEADTKATFTVNSDVTIDLGGHKLESAYGKPAIIINGGNVTVKNGQVYSRFAQVSSAEMLQTVFEKSPSGIVVNNGSLTVEGVRVVGSMARVPTTTEYFFPTGTAIMTKNGATVTLKQATLIGDYGVNDKVTGAQPGGAVTIEDAIILAYNKIVKSGLDTIVLGENTEMVNAADRVEGFLNSGISLEAKERKLLKEVFDERAYVFTKAPTADQTGKITVTEGVDVAKVEASTISYLWANTTSTDCSYELIPEQVKLSDGTYAALDAVDAAKVDEDAQILYRVKFHVCDDCAEQFLAPFVADPQYWIDLNWWGSFIQEEYEWNISNNAGPIDSYNEAVIAIGEALKTLDDLGNETIPGIGAVDEIEMFNKLRVAIVELGGATAYGKGRTNAVFTYPQYKYYYSTVGKTKTEADFAAQNGVFGTLDRVQKLVDELGTFAPFTNTAKWGDIAVWAYDNYEEAIAIVRDAAAKIDALNTMLQDDTIKQVLALNADLKATAALVSQYAGYADLAVDAIDEALAFPDVQAVIAKLDDNKGEIKKYVNKFVGIANNLDTYVTVSDFISADGKVVKAYSTLGPVVIERVAGANKLDITITGEGKVDLVLPQIDGTSLTPEADEGFQSYDFYNRFTLTADPESGWELLYWYDTQTNRILSTETSYTLGTNIDRAITAVFNPDDEGYVTYTNPTGAIAGDGYFEAGVITPNGTIADPYIPGFAFTGWPTAFVAADKNNYASGNSVFANPSDFYTGEGFVLEVRPDCLSLIITPKFDRSSDMTVKLVDPAINHTYIAKGPFGNTTDPVTAQGSSFSYWAVNGKPVNLKATYQHTIVGDAVVTAVYGVAAPDAVTTIVGTKSEGGIVSFYAQRSSKVAIKTCGVVFSYTNPVPEIGQEGAVKGTSKYNTADGMYIAGIRETSIQNKGNGTVYARPFIETADGIVYGDVVPYTIGQ